jgi:hypothetical protein
MEKKMILVYFLVEMIKELKYKIMEYGQTAYNRTVYASPQ